MNIFSDLIEINFCTNTAYTKFKYDKLIGNENIEFVQYLLNCFLKFEKPIEELHYQPTELNPLSKEKKLSIVDLMFKDALGRYFIIEMQQYPFENLVLVSFPFNWKGT